MELIRPVLFCLTLFCLASFSSLGRRLTRRREDGEIWRSILGYFRDAQSQLGYPGITVNQGPNHLPGVSLIGEHLVFGEQHDDVVFQAKALESSY